MGDSTLVSELTARMEHEIDSMRTDGKFCFVVPGETPLNAWLHVARAKCRTAERRLWTMNASYPLDPEIMKFVNRLDRKSTRLNSSHANISYAVFCLKKKKKKTQRR